MECILINENILNFRSSGNLEIVPKKLRKSILGSEARIKHIESNIKLPAAFGVPQLGSSNPYLDRYDLYGDIITERTQLTNECEELSNYENMAYNIVDDVLDKAVEHLRKRLHIEVEDCNRRTSVVSNIHWPTIGEFTIQEGGNKIQQYIDFTSDVREHWRYNLTFLEKKSDSVSEFYIYSALFSIPTTLYPVPQVSVEIKFTIEACKCQPQSCPVIVSYSLEGCELVMIPGKQNITEEMLSRSANMKIEFFKKLKC